MAERDLIERLNFKGDDVLLDGEKIFSVPHRDSKSEINLLGVLQSGRMLYVGSGKCCYGPISILTNHSQEGQEPNFQLDSIRVPDFNVYDIIPTCVDWKKTGFANEGAILTTGYGCAGSGVRLISTCYPKTIEVVSGEEFHEMWNPRVQNYVMPYLNVNDQKGTISLDLFESGFRPKPGKSRNPKLPSILIDLGSEEWYEPQNVWASKDLTSVLNQLGVDVEKTIEANKGYVRIRH